MGGMMKLKVGDVVQYIDHEHIRKLRIIRCYNNGAVDAIEFETWHTPYKDRFWGMVYFSDLWRLINRSEVEDRFKFHKDRVESRHRSNHV